MQFIHERKDIHVDIDEYPQALAATAGDVTIGDINGNALYLLNTLLRLKVVNLSKANYETFKSLYYMPIDRWQDSDIESLQTILRQLSIYDHRRLRFLGDIFADRGNNDFLTLKLLEALDNGGAEYTITLSNHDFEFISFIEQTNFFHGHYEKTLGNIDVVAKSLQNFIKLLQQNTLSKHVKATALSPLRLKAAAQNGLMRHIKAIDYCYANDEEERAIAIFSHAAIDLNLIEQIAKELGTDFDKTNGDKLAKSIDNINAKIEKRLCEGSLIHLFPELYVKTRKPGIDITQKGASALSRLLWNRDISDLYFKTAPLVRYFVHGHDKPSVSEGVYSLDNDLGKETSPTKGTVPLWLVNFKGLEDTMVVETAVKTDSSDKTTLVVTEQTQKKLRRFDVRSTTTMEVVLPKEIDTKAAYERVKTLYRYESKVTQAKLAMIASPLFEDHINKRAEEDDEPRVIYPSLYP